MIETTNTIVFWLGYGVALSAGILLIYVIVMVLIKQLSEFTDVFWRHYTYSVNKHILEWTDEEFEEEISKLRKLREK